MLGLIKKDLFFIKSNLKILVILFVVYAFMTFQHITDLSFILPFMSIVIMLSTFSYDIFNKWDAYVIALPDGRKNSVRAKYLATIILISITTIILALLTIIISYVQTKTIDIENIFSTILASMFATTLLQSFIYPAIYKFGVEKARIGIFIIVFGISIITNIISKFVDFKPILRVLDNLGNYWMIILPIVMIVILYLSYKISENIYMKKEY